MTGRERREARRLCFEGKLSEGDDDEEWRDRAAAEGRVGGRSFGFSGRIGCSDSSSTTLTAVAGEAVRGASLGEVS